VHWWSILIQHNNTIASDQDADYGIFLLSQPSQEQRRQRGAQTINYVWKKWKTKQNTEECRLYYEK
jgi:hypothetical protein